MSQQHIDWKRRGTAAEKTMDVLKRRVRSLYNEGAQTAIHRQLERAREREEEARRRREVMSARNEELERHSAALEATVARRTADLRAILDNVTFGFLVMDEACRVQPGFTRSCEGLLGKPVREGDDVCALLEMTGTTNDSMFRAGIEQVFEDLMPEEVSVEQLPGQFVLGGRRVRAECRAIRRDDDSIENVLVTISDVTPLYEAERRAQQNAALVGILRQKSAFSAFVADAFGRLESCRGALGDTAYVRRSVHTIKGNAASYGLVDVADAAHGVESREAIGSDDLGTIEAALGSFLAEHEDVLGADVASGAGAIEVGQADLDLLRGLLDPLDPDALAAWGQRISRRPVGELLGPIDVFVSRVAERADRAVSFSASGLDTPVDPDVMGPVIATLSHLIRNAIDHGIEPRDERGEKPGAGALSLDVAREDDAWTIEVADDGRGIDLARLAERAVERGDLSRAQIEAMDEAGRAELIFLDGLSSRDAVSELSGRGVGMGAVREAVAGQGGTIDVCTEAGRGTRFRIAIPAAV